MVTTQPSAPAPLYDPARPPRRGPVLFGILAAILIAATALGLLLYASLRTPAKHHVLVVRSSQQWDGTELYVDGGKLPAPRFAIIAELGNYMVPFFLPAGRYVLRVQSHGEQVYSREVDLERNETVEIDLTRTGASTRPSTQPTTRPV